ncbi:MAG: hydrogenase small subunit [Candidatus Palauibacterales bacterium]|nr:hydrogenase small subunit [Candidatus Palauibacterales bacterium]
MSTVSRREFMGWMGRAGVGATLLEVIPFNIARALEAAIEEFPLLWLQLSNCSGCSVSVINTIHPSIENVLLDQIIPGYQLVLAFQQTVMAASGELAVKVLDRTHEEYKGRYVLIIEGAIPTRDGGVYGSLGETAGKPVPLADRVRTLAPDAMAVLCVGTCAAYGGISAAKPNPSGCMGTGEFFKREGISTPIVNIPGCPPHPDWFIGTVAHILLLGLPGAEDVDEHGRMKLFYGTTIHRSCTRRDYLDDGVMAQKPGDMGCLLELGCKGPFTKADCSRRSWNSGVNWCIGSGGPCIGCTDPSFPDGCCPLLVLPGGVSS